MVEQESGADVALKVAGQEINVRNVKSLNTGMTIATFIVVVCAAVIGWQMFDAHAKDAKENGTQLVAALRELAKAHRETSGAQVREQRMLNCLIVADQKDRRRAWEDCERITR